MLALCETVECRVESTRSVLTSAATPGSRMKACSAIHVFRKATQDATASVVTNPTRWEQILSRLRGAVITALQAWQARSLAARAAW